MKREGLGTVKKANSKRPFERHFRINHVTSSRLWGLTSLSDIGFDVIVIALSTPSDILNNANIQNNSRLLLQAGEKGMFVRERTASDKYTGRALTGDQFVGELHRANKALIPRAMDRCEAPGPLFEHFLVGAQKKPLVVCNECTPWAKAMNERSGYDFTLDLDVSGSLILFCHTSLCSLIPTSYKRGDFLF